MCFEPCKVLMYNRIIVHEGTGGQGVSHKMLLSLHYLISVLNEFVLSQQKESPTAWFTAADVSVFFFSEAAGEECIADEKQDPVPPTEWVTKNSWSVPPPPLNPAPPWSLIKFSPVLPCFYCGKIRKPSLLIPWPSPPVVLPLVIKSYILIQLSRRSGLDAFHVHIRAQAQRLNVSSLWMWGSLSSLGVWCVTYVNMKCGQLQIYFLTCTVHIILMNSNCNPDAY